MRFPVGPPKLQSYFPFKNRIIRTHLGGANHLVNPFGVGANNPCALSAADWEGENMRWLGGRGEAASKHHTINSSTLQSQDSAVRPLLSRIVLSSYR